LVKGTGKTVVAAAEDTLGVAEDALAAATKTLKKVRIQVKKRAAPASRAR
jgi:hypothetical protein